MHLLRTAAVIPWANVKTLAYSGTCDQGQEIVLRGAEKTCYYLNIFLLEDKTKL